MIQEIDCKCPYCNIDLEIIINSYHGVTICPDCNHNIYVEYWRSVWKIIQIVGIVIRCINGQLLIYMNLMSMNTMNLRNIYESIGTFELYHDGN